jgi:hypothetical protein
LRPTCPGNTPRSVMAYPRPDAAQNASQENIETNYVSRPSGVAYLISQEPGETA